MLVLLGEKVMSIEIGKKLLERVDFTVKLRSIKAIEVLVSKEVFIELEVRVSVWATTVVLEVSVAMVFLQVLKGLQEVVQKVSKEYLEAAVVWEGVSAV